MTSKVIYKGDLRTEARHLKSGNTIVTDAPTDNKGKGEAFSPTDLVATALASCMVTIMGIKANEKGIDIVGTEIDVEKIMASNPRRIDRVNINISMPSNQYTAEQKELLEEAARSCPVCKSLLPGIGHLQFNW